MKKKELFLSYLNGSLDTSEEELLVEYLQESPDFLDECRDLLKLWQLGNLERDLGAGDPAKAFRTLESQLNDQKQPRRMSSWMGWAASFFLGALLSFLAAYQFIQPANSNLVYHEVNAPAGAKTRVSLPDGSKIWLNAGSRIRYSNEYGIKSRTINLLGEAYFEVARDKKRVFVVQTSDLDITAYGTTFNVKCYPEENTIETTLVEGSVGVVRKIGKKSAREIILEPNQRVVYYKAKEPAAKETEDPLAATEERTVKRSESPRKLTYMVSKGINTEPFTSWTEGRLVIKSESLSELAVKLERKYDVKIDFADEELKAFRFSGSLEDETIEQIITAIGLAANIEYEIDERHILIKQK